MDSAPLSTEFRVFELKFSLNLNTFKGWCLWLWHSWTSWRKQLLVSRGGSGSWLREGALSLWSHSAQQSHGAFSKQVFPQILFRFQKAVIFVRLENRTVRKTSSGNSCYLTALGLLLENVISKFRAKILPEVRSGEQWDLKAALFPHCLVCCYCKGATSKAPGY